MIDVCIVRATMCAEVTQGMRDYFFLCLFFLRRFLRLCVAILCFFLFFPLGIVIFLRPICTTSLGKDSPVG
jgi:hypothetical protein